MCIHIYIYIYNFYLSPSVSYVYTHDYTYRTLYTRLWVPASLVSDSSAGRLHLGRYGMLRAAECFQWEFSVGLTVLNYVLTMGELRFNSGL